MVVITRQQQQQQQQQQQNDGVFVAASDATKAGDILRMRRETADMERMLRRKFILASIEHAAGVYPASSSSSNAAAAAASATSAMVGNNNNNNNHDTSTGKLRELWRKLSHDEREADDEIVYKFLSCCGCGPTSLFGNDPWHGTSQRNQHPHVASNVVAAANDDANAAAVPGGPAEATIPMNAAAVRRNVVVIDRRAQQLAEQQQQQQRGGGGQHQQPHPMVLRPAVRGRAIVLNFGLAANGGLTANGRLAAAMGPDGNNANIMNVNNNNHNNNNNSNQQRVTRSNNSNSSSTSNNNSNNTSHQQGGLMLPRRYHDDPGAVLAFCSNPHVESLPWYFEVPQSMHDNESVMMAVVQKCPRAFYQASARLRDQCDDLVCLALQKPVSRNVNIALVSSRLATSGNLLMYAVTYGYATLSFAQSWLQNLGDAISTMDLRHQKQIARHMLRCIRLHVENNDSCASTTLGGGGIGILDESSMTFLSKFALELRDDPDFMLPFVKLHWSALQYCSDRLRSNVQVFHVAVAQDVNAYLYAKGDIRQAYLQRGDFYSVVDIVLDEIVNRGLFYENVPTHLQNDRAILAAVLKRTTTTATTHQRLPPHLPEPLKNDKMFFHDVLAAHYSGGGTPHPSGGHPVPHHHHHHHHRGIIVKWLYDEMSPQLRLDESIAMAMLKAGCPRPELEKILTNVPRLKNSREAMLAIVVTCRYTDVFRLESSLPFRDDDNFMLQAYRSESATFVHASERLRGNREFITAVLDWNRRVPEQQTGGKKSSFIIHTTIDFQLDNPDVVAQAILCGERKHMQWVSKLSTSVWRHREVILACLEKGCSVLDHVYALSAPFPLSGPVSPFLNDREIVARSVALGPANLVHASGRLRGDPAFVMSLVQETDRVLHLHMPV